MILTLQVIANFRFKCSKHVNLNFGSDIAILDIYHIQNKMSFDKYI